MSKNQKAILFHKYGGIEELKKEEIEIPEPNEGEVQINIKATSMNPVEYKLRRGYLKNYPTEFPVCPGWDVSGVISKVGYGVSHFKVGDEVYAYGRRQKIGKNLGSFCEYTVLPAEFVCMKPKNLTFAEAGTVPLTGLTSYQCYEKSKLKKGDTALILGASGGVGSFGVQYMKILGITCIAVASEKNHEYLKKIGADYCIDYKSNVAEEVEKIMKGKKIDAILDFFGGDGLEKNEKLVKEGGYCISIGNWTFKPKHTKYDTVFVVPSASQLEILKKWLEEGKLKTHLFKTFKFDQFVEATKMIEEGNAHVGKIAMEI